MATQIQGKQLLLANYGPTVVRAAAALPATTTAAIFNISGGNVIITSIVGQVVTAIQNQACTVLLNVLNTAAGGAGNGYTTATDIANAAIGTFVGFPAAGGATTVNSAFASQNNEFIAGVGSLRITTSATNTGTVKWYCNYISLDPGAFVTAA